MEKVFLDLSVCCYDQEFCTHFNVVKKDCIVEIYQTEVPLIIPAAGPNPLLLEKSEDSVFIQEQLDN